jgi:nascent polypeptide-associated complex subunit beta
MRTRKPLQELLPGIVSQLGIDNINQLQSAMAAQGAMGGGGGESSMPTVEEDDDDDDDVPDLVDGNFEEISEAA